MHAVVSVRRDSNDHRHFHVVHVLRERIDTLAGLEAVFRLAKTYGAHDWVLDDDFFLKSLKGFAAEKMRTSSHHLAVHALPLGGKPKEVRASALRAMLADGRVHLLADQEWTQNLVDELLLFPLGGDNPGVDDQIDALSVLARDLARTTGTTPDLGDLVTYTVPDGEQLTVERCRSFSRAEPTHDRER